MEHKGCPLSGYHEGISQIKLLRTLKVSPTVFSFSVVGNFAMKGGGCEDSKAISSFLDFSGLYYRYLPSFLNPLNFHVWARSNFSNNFTQICDPRAITKRHSNIQVCMAKFILLECISGMPQLYTTKSFHNEGVKIVNIITYPLSLYTHHASSSFFQPGLVKWYTLCWENWGRAKAECIALAALGHNRVIGII